jgi:broad specificity phosphatase PhoE
MAAPVLYFVRHGLTDWNAAGRLQGQRDVELNAIGRAQAVRSAEILRELFERDGRVPADFGYVSRARASRI